MATFELMNTIEKTSEFNEWIENLRDHPAKLRIFNRIDRAALGNFGDCESVGEGISEMRIHYGPGYRVYFTRCNEVIYLLLIGGDKSTQTQDIAHAKTIFKSLPKE